MASKGVRYLMMDVTRNVGNNHIDGAVYMDLKHWKRLINTVLSITSFQFITKYFYHYLSFVSVSYYGSSVGISIFLTYRNSIEIQNIFKTKQRNCKLDAAARWYNLDAL